MVSRLTSSLRARLRSAAGSIRSVWNWHAPAANHRLRAVHLALGYLAALVIAMLLLGRAPSPSTAGYEAVLLFLLLYTASYWKWPSVVFPLALALVVSARMAVLLTPAGLTGFSRAFAIGLPVLAVVAIAWSTITRRRRLDTRRQPATWRALAEDDASHSDQPGMPRVAPALSGLAGWGRGLLPAPGTRRAAFPAVGLVLAGMLGLFVAGDGQPHLNVRSTLSAVGSDAAFVLGHLPWSEAKALPAHGTGEATAFFRDRYAGYDPTLALDWEGVRDPCRLLADAFSNQDMLECQGRPVPGARDSRSEAVAVSSENAESGEVTVASAPEGADQPADLGDPAAGQGDAPVAVGAQPEAAPVTPSSPEAAAQNLSAGAQGALHNIVLARVPQMSETLQQPRPTGQGGDNRPADTRPSGNRLDAAPSRSAEISGKPDQPADKPQGSAPIQTPSGVIPWPEGLPVVVSQPTDPPAAPEQPAPTEQPTPEIDLSQCPGTTQENSYPYGQCTWYVKTRRPDIPWFAGDTGDATNWADSATKCGYVVDEVPEVGAAVVWQAWTNGFHQYGHVAYVEEVGSDYIVVSECNILYTNDTTWYEGSHACAFRYVPLYELDPATRFIHGRIGQ